MKLISIMAAVMVALLAAGHFAWVLFAPTPSPAASLIAAYGIGMLKLVMYISVVVAGTFAYKHLLMMLLFGMTRRQNRERPPEKYTSYDECGESEGDHRNDRANTCSVMAFGLSALGAGLLAFAGADTLFLAGLVYAWVAIVAPIRLKMAPRPAPKKPETD